MIIIVAGIAEAEKKCTNCIKNISYLNFIKIFVTIIPKRAETIDEIHIGTIILLGAVEPSEVLIAITFVGISWMAAIFIIINIIIELLKVSFLVLSFCNVYMACKPIGVLAFPKPKKFVTIFIEISSLA